MPHYSSVVSVSRLQFDMLLGFLPNEMKKKQTVEVSFRLYFAESMPCNYDDNAMFFDYGEFSDALKAFVDAKQYNLIEFAGMRMFEYLRERVNARGGENVKIWFQLNKIGAPVTGLQGGASFVHSDLPPDSTYIPSQLL